MLSLRNIAFGLLMLLYLGYPLSLIHSYDNVTAEGYAYRIRPIPVDPYDAFRGAYLTLSYNNRIPFERADSLLRRDQPVYVQLGQDSLGYDYFASLSLEPPNTSAYFKTRINDTGRKEAYIKIPDNIQRYFLPEKQALLAEKAYRERMWSAGGSASVYIDVKVLDGEIVIEELYLDNLPVLDYLNSLPVPVDKEGAESQ